MLKLKIAVVGPTKVKIMPIIYMFNRIVVSVSFILGWKDHSRKFLS